MRTETFDRDPQWDAKNNRVVPTKPPTVNQDFGYVRRGGGAGEIGGEVWRSVKFAYYGKRVGPFTMNDKLRFSGTLSLVEATAIVGWQTGSTIFVGFFNHETSGWWRPLDFIGFRLEGYNEPDGATVEVSYGTSAWTAGGAFVNAAGGSQERNVRELEANKLLRIAPDGAKHTWSLEYDPKGGDGYGLITFTFDGKQTTLKIDR